MYLSWYSKVLHYLSEPRFELKDCLGINEFYFLCQDYLSNTNILLERISDTLKKYLLNDKLSKEEEKLIFSGSTSSTQDLGSISNSIAPCNNLELEMQRFKESHNAEVETLRAKVSSLESKIDSVRSV